VSQNFLARAAGVVDPVKVFLLFRLIAMENLVADVGMYRRSQKLGDALDSDRGWPCNTPRPIMRYRAEFGH